MKIMINDTHKFLYFLDCEYDDEDLRQLAVIKFKQDYICTYELVGSINIYIKDEKDLSPFFTGFTGINKAFLSQYGVDLEEAKEQFYNFVESPEQSLFIGHGIHGDKHILFKNGIDLYNYDCYCTVTKAKELLKERDSYTLENLAADEGWFLASPHDAYHDALALIPIFSKLKEM